ncbi:right-handed parallel beta-helix repeat-containing protein [Rhizobium cremeum]|uniref:right-handed parallel beta-helix repeat-containing protein n=1 Tax=Rhizobium cremeum TaxID=2813827 RepID=UPI001FD4A155|nr:right-handed parallel beta-helix repeat-containing protein [Rhizobium cremeum]MCJ7993206.1 right-handed parallel beta-helix repeat-containing protein [Rhizobium cremeum]MCJ7998271.1 right-handed parallel beta-helix repeat-containing protein [Rhizobium cremeum]
MTNPYPLPRFLRQTDILVGDGTETYGPFDDFKIWDVEDVEVWARAEGEAGFAQVFATVAKLDADEAFDFFTIAFADDVPATTQFVVGSFRTHERTAGVISGTRVNPTALEKELSKQGTVLQELRRDVDRGWKSDFGQPGMTMDANVADGDTLMKQGDRLVKGPDAAQIAAAQGYAEAAAASAAAAAEDADDAAEAAASIAAVIEGLSPVFASKAAAEAYSPAIAPSFLRLAGYYAAGDGGGALYKKVDAEPAHIGKFSIALLLGGTVWYELAESVVAPEMLGARCLPAYDDKPALQAALDGWRTVRLTPGKTYYPRSTVTMSVSDTKLESDETAAIFVDKAYFNNNNPYIAGDARIAAVNAGSGGWALNATGRYGTNAVVLYVTGEQSLGGARNARSRVSGIRFVGNNPSGLMQTVVLARNTQDFTIEHCSFTAFGMGYCVLLGGTHGSRVRQNLFYDLVEAGIYPATSAGDAADCAPNVTAIATTNDFAALHGPGWKPSIHGNRIRNVHFTGAGLARHGDQSDGINMTEMGQNTGLQIYDNHIEDVAEGMDIFERYGRVAGNHLFDCNIFGMKFTYGASFLTIDDNVVNNSGAAAMVFDSPDGYETRNNIGSGNILYNADPTTYTDNGLIQFSSSGTGSTHSNSILDGEYAPVNAKTIVRNTANVGSNPPNKVTGRVLGPGTHADAAQRYCSQSWAGLEFRSHMDTFVSAALAGAQNAAASNVSTTVQFSDAAGIDTLGEWDNATYTFTPLFPGFYEISAQVRLSGLATSDAMVTQILKSGTGIKNRDGMGQSDGALTQSVSGVFWLTPVIGGTSDSIRIAVAQSNAAAKPITTVAAYTNLSIRRI